ncbi:MAG: hypothetical protein VB108_02325 [Anaerolineaceae bacterium]|nr:hypothetical protein [Anaerolineaceae bacterium]
MVDALKTELDLIFFRVKLFDGNCGCNDITSVNREQKTKVFLKQDGTFSRKFSAEQAGNFSLAYQPVSDSALKTGFDSR